MNYVNFEFDPVKSASNKFKHGLDFVEAQELWRNRTVVIPAVHRGEERLLVIGRIGEKHWSAIITLRGQSIRIISIRRAKDHEKRIYQNKIY